MSKDTCLIMSIVSSDWSVNVEDLKNVQFPRISLVSYFTASGFRVLL